MGAISIYIYISHSVVSNSLQPHGLYSSWNSPGQNAGVGSLSLLQGIFPTLGLNPGLPHAGRFFTSWATREVYSQNHGSDWDHSVGIGWEHRKSEGYQHGKDEQGRRN